MNDLKDKNIEVANKVWELYNNGMDKSTISKELSINRAEVTHIIKYTTHTQYLSNNQSEKNLQVILKEKETLSESLAHWKYSNSDAYLDSKKTGDKLTYKRLVDIHIKKIKTLEQKTVQQKLKLTTLKKWYWVFFTVMLFSSFITGGLMKGYIMEKQNYRIIDTSLTWESQEGDTLYKLLKKN